MGKMISKESQKKESQKKDEGSFKPMQTKDLLGLDEAILENIYGQGYRLYNTGRYKEALKLFRLLIMLNAQESKYAMGIAACFHMLADYELAAEYYSHCALLNSCDPLPHFHAADCHLKLQKTKTALYSLEQAVAKAGNLKEYKVLKERAEMTIAALRKEIAQKDEDHLKDHSEEKSVQQQKNQNEKNRQKMVKRRS